MSYKIRISCTHKKNLSYNEKKITKTNYHKNIHNIEYIERKLILYKNIEYIERKLILYKNKKLKNFTTKTLEFDCNDEIDKDEFIKFIKYMQNNGYSSEKDTCIQFIKVNNNNEKLNNNNETIFEYHFQSIREKKHAIPKKRKPNNSNYRTQILYLK
jgi:hypothetical protein